MSPLIIYPDSHITLPVQYFGCVGYYAVMAAYGHVHIDADARFDKRFKTAHRMTIADTHGVMQLTVPISKPQGIVGRPLRWSDILISRHGDWWNVHQQTLASAYGRTPFFEFYIDRLRPYFSTDTPDRFPSISTLDLALNATICSILGIPIPDAIKNGDSVENPENTDVVPILDYTQITSADHHYYQVRADRFGFIPALSILDLIFNLGPEAPLHLHRLIHHL